MARDKSELLSLIADYKTYKALSEASFRNNPNHSFMNDLERIIKMCDEKLIYLYTELKSIEEKEK